MTPATTWSWCSPPRATPPTTSSKRPWRSTPTLPSARWTCSSPPVSRSPSPWPPCASRRWAIPSSASPAGRWAWRPARTTPAPASARWRAAASARSSTSTASCWWPASRASTATATSPPWAAAAPTPPLLPWLWRSRPICARSTPTWTACTPPIPGLFPTPRSSTPSPTTKCWSWRPWAPRCSTTAPWSWPSGIKSSWKFSQVSPETPVLSSRRS